MCLGFTSWKGSMKCGLPVDGGLSLDAESGKCMGWSCNLLGEERVCTAPRELAGFGLTRCCQGLVCHWPPGFSSTGLAAHRLLTIVMPLVWGPGPNPGLLSVQVLGLVRVPLYTQKDRVGGFPNFLSNAFISTAKYQLLFALKVLNMMPEEKLAEAVAAATEKQKKALEKLLPTSS